jgi:hypothetical protein
MKKITKHLKRIFSRTQKEPSSLEILESKKEKMKTELESLSEFEFFLKELTKQQ